MARSINKVILLGNLTRDPILRHTQNGTPVCDFGIATNRTWTTEQGEKRVDADFHNIVAWGKRAEIASQYLKKGRKVYVEGRLQTRTYEAQDGAKKSRTEIIINDMVMLDTHIPGTTEAHAAPAESNGHSKTEPVEDHSPDLDIPSEEIPF
jgi:single-strand DNA-binding protein